MKAKAECRPDKSEIMITSSKASTTINALAKHTISRIVYHNSLIEQTDEGKLS